MLITLCSTNNEFFQSKVYYNYLLIIGTNNTRCPMKMYILFIIRGILGLKIIHFLIN